MTHDAPVPAARFVAVSLDCADPADLAGFYQKLLGGVVMWHSADSVGLQAPGAVLAMQRAEDYRPPAWPGSSVVHLAPVGDLEDAAAHAVQAGAVMANFQPDPRWRVLLDPAGCVSRVRTISVY